MNLKKIQILSAPRMGTTMLHRVLSQINWDSESKTNQHSAEILNNAEETTTELEYQNLNCKSVIRLYYSKVLMCFLLI